MTILEEALLEATTLVTEVLLVVEAILQTDHQEEVILQVDQAQEDRLEVLQEEEEEEDNIFY